ncbi:MAG: GNAT family N-acetyltransferase [Clostridia bacterium]|nr:GNAT family N-acetyltransferase [Clostridia bacterium]
MKDRTQTKRLILTAADGTPDGAGEKKDDGLFSLPPLPEEGPGQGVIEIAERASGRRIGTVRCADADSAGTVEIDLTVYVQKDGERVAAEALKGASRLIFRRQKNAKKIETWLDPSLPAIRALEKAGFERVFEKDGVVRYEKRRPDFPALAVFMILFTLWGTVLGGLMNDYPLWISIGVAAGILPGAAVERMLKKR